MIPQPSINPTTIVMFPRSSPVVNLVYEMSCKMFYRLVSQIYISWWAYVIVRLESLSVEGKEPDVVHVSMQNINKNINAAACRPTRWMSDGGLSFHRVGKGLGAGRWENGAKCGA
jgi:hypothetical protein